MIEYVSLKKWNFFGEGWKHFGKRRKCWLLAFSPFQTFSRLYFLKFFNPFPNKPWFLRVCSRSLLKTLWEKEKLLVTSNFSFSHSVFYPFGELSAIFIKLKIVICKLFQFWRVWNLSFRKGLKSGLWDSLLSLYQTKKFCSGQNWKLLQMTKWN